VASANGLKQIKYPYKVHNICINQIFKKLELIYTYTPTVCD